MSSFKEGSGKWFLAALLSGYVFAIWAMMALVFGMISGHWSMLWACLIAGLVFYFAIMLAWYRKNEQIYRVASLSKWVDNITFVNDKGTVSIRQDRITEIIDINTEASVIEHIAKTDPEFLRIKVSLIADAKSLAEEFENYSDEGLEEMDEMIEKMHAIDETKIGDVAGEKDPLQFKYKYFRVSNIVQPDNVYASVISRKPVSVFSKEYRDTKGTLNVNAPDDDKKLDAEAKLDLAEIEDLESQLKEIDIKIEEIQKEIDEFNKNGKKKESEAAKKKVVSYIGEQTDISAKISALKAELKEKNIDPDKKPVEEEIPYEETPNKTDDSDESKESGDNKDADEEIDEGDKDKEVENTAYDGEEEPKEDEEKAVEKMEIIDLQEPKSNELETYRVLHKSAISKLTGNIVDLFKKIGQKLKDDVFDKYIYRTFQTNAILDVMNSEKIETIEDLRNCDKVRIGRSIGFNSEEMKEFVKFVESVAKKKEMGFWKDLIPEEYRKFLMIKSSLVQIKNPQSYIYLITFAEPIEIMVPKNVIAKSFLDVDDKPRLKDEEVDVSKRRFEQAIYILPDKFEECMNFLPGGSASLEGYDVVVPMTYATFVLKGWMTNSIPMLKAIATAYDVNREIDDYKNFMSHELTVLKTMVGYVNHIKSNTNLLSEQVEYTNKELESMQDEMDRQRQLRLHQMYFKSGGFVSPDAIEGMFVKPGETNAPAKKSKAPIYIIGFVMFILVIILIFAVLK